MWMLLRRTWTRDQRDAVILTVLVLAALAWVPDRPLWGNVLNLYRVVQLLGMLLLIQSLGYVSRRVLSARHAVVLSSVASGFVSSTATIASMGVAVRAGHGDARLMAGAGLLSCGATFLQALVVAFAIQPAWLGVLWGPALSGTVVALVGGWWLTRVARLGQAGMGPVPVGVPTSQLAVQQDERLFSLSGAVAVVGLLSGVQALVYGLQLWWGEAGVLGGILLASVVDLHAAMTAALALGPPGQDGGGVQALALAIGVHGLGKAVTASLSGGLPYARWLLPGLALHTLVGVAGLLLQA